MTFMRITLLSNYHSPGPSM